MLEQKLDESLFWAYELYFSGYEKETIEFVNYMYLQFYKKENPQKTVDAFITKRLEEWNNNLSDHTILATMIRYLITRKHIYSSSNDNAVSQSKLPSKRTYNIIYQENDIVKYKTFENTDSVDNRKIPVWKILPHVCKYPVVTSTTAHPACKLLPAELFGEIPTITMDEICNIWRTHWMYYGCELWKTRIALFGGIYNDELKTVKFDDDVNEEEFYGLYSYEPDEQSLETRMYCLGF